MLMIDQRTNPRLRRLVAAGNVCALIVSDPSKFDAETRALAVEAWDQQLDALRAEMKETQHGSDS
jgi:hypothetical protein